MHIKRCMMHKCMTMKHLMHEGSYKDRKNLIKDQKSISSTIRILSHPNGMIVWNECLMRSEMRVRRMKIGDTRSQGCKNIKNFLKNLPFSIKSGLACKAQFQKSSSLLLLFYFILFL